MADRNRYRPYVGPKGSQPPSLEQPPEGEAPLPTLGDEHEAGGVIFNEGQEKDALSGGSPPGLDQHLRESPSEYQGEEEDEEKPSEIDWQKRGQDAFRSSTDYFDENFRQPLEDSLRAFNNRHPGDSKYNTDTFKKRSHLYRPKTRIVMRKNEAALCAALFSNLDLIECSAANPQDQEEVVSAEIMQQVLQERLTVTMPWFKFAIGAMQDAQTQGIVIAHSYWRYRAAGEGAAYKVIEDRPVQELVPMENFRFDPSSAWDDVVNTSPYLIHLIPMTVGEVKGRMKNPDPKGQKWKSLDDKDLLAARRNTDESTRAARTNLATDAAEHSRDIADYEVIWVHRHIHRVDGVDMEWYMLESEQMLSDPEPLATNVWFGERPYDVGFCVLETHRAAPSSIPTLTRALQDEANDLDNQLSDNMKFILNKKWIAKRSANVDTGSLVRNVPGGVTLVNDIEKDLKEITWPDIPQSALVMKDRNDSDFDALAGNFNPMALQQQRTPRESFRTVNAVQSPAMMMTEYTLMTLVQTFLLPVLRKLVLLEQYYESDMVLLALAGQKAQIAQRFGVSEITDAILEKRMSVNVNLGMGATDPTMKQQRLHAAINVMVLMQKAQLRGLDQKEVRKELFALAGYRDALRFISEDQDPEKLQLLQTVQLLMRKLQDLQRKVGDKHESNVVKLTTSREKNITDLVKSEKEDEHQSRHLLVGHLLEMERAEQAAEHARTAAAEGAMHAGVQQAAGHAGQMEQIAAKAKAAPGAAAPAPKAA
jgi:hypothetical protein